MSYKVYDESCGVEEIVKTLDEAKARLHEWARDIDIDLSEEERAFILYLIDLNSNNCNIVTRAIQKGNETIYSIRYLNDEIVEEFTQYDWWTMLFPTTEDEYNAGMFDGEEDEDF